MAATLKSLARQLNLSHTTVAKILNNDPTFRTTDETRQRVRALAAEQGYRPAVAARHLLRGQTRHLGLLLHDLHDPFFAAIAHGIERAVADAGYGLVLGLGASEAQASADSPFDPTNWYVDGLIAGLFGYYREGVLREWNRRMPVVALGYPGFVEPLSERQEFGINIGKDLPFVDFHQYHGSEQVGRHLVEQGCQRIAYVGWQDPRRQEGLRAGVAAAGGGVVEETILPGPYTVNILSETRLSTVREAIRERLAAGEPFPDGLFCFNDIVAGVVFGELRRHGLRVPDNVCLVGYNDDPEARYREVPLSSVAIPMEDLCRSAVSSVLSRLNGDDYPACVVLEPTLIVRESSRRGRPPL